jgi:Flp pilus assembly protein CpaB
MSLDKIVVLVLAIAFFGGIAFVYWKSRQAEQKTGQTPSPAAPKIVEEDSSKQLPEKARKTSKQ